MTDITKLIEESERLIDAATPGQLPSGEVLSEYVIADADMELFDHARTALPLLIAEIERLRAAQTPIPLQDAPKDGSPVLVETRGTGKPLLSTGCIQEVEMASGSAKGPI